MAKLNYTNDDLLNEIKLGCMVPISQIALSDEDILTLASQELELPVLASVLKARQEYNVYVEEQAKNSSGEYPIPSRASGGKLRSVFLKDQNNNLYKCSLVSVDQVPLLDNYYNQGVWDPMFYVQNEKVIFLNQTAQSISASAVVFHYYLDPNELVMKDQCLTIRSINTVTGVLEVDERQIPGNYQADIEIDFIQKKPQNIIKKTSVAVVSVSSNVPVSSTKFITVDPSDLPSDLIVGDYIAVAGTSPVPQLVSNLRPLLVQCTICTILESQGDNNNLPVALKKRDRLVKDLSALIQDRTEGNPQKIVNRTGVMAASRIGYNGRRRGNS